MFRVTREIRFCYGHRLLGHAGKCRFLHGHNGRAVVVLESAATDALGMVVDFGAVKDEVVLYDPDGRRIARFTDREITPQQTREWAFAGWCALADLGKYLRRGSVWEALGRLNRPPWAVRPISTTLSTVKAKVAAWDCGT